MKNIAQSTTVLISFIAMTAMTTASQAFAHAHLVESEPARNATVQKKPQQVVLHFSEELETSMCKVEVKELKGSEIVSDGKVETEGKDGSTLRVALKPLREAKAVYEISWKAVSKDTHRMKGTYQFTFDPAKGKP